MVVEMKSQNRKFMMTAIAGLLAVWSIFIMYSNAPFYIDVSRATQGMEVTLVDFQWEGGTTILVIFEFDNISSLDITLNSLIFNIYANADFMGNFDMRERKVLPPGKTRVSMKIDIQERYIDELSTDQSITWALRGGAIIELPVGEDTTYNIPFMEWWEM